MCLAVGAIVAGKLAANAVFAHNIVNGAGLVRSQRINKTISYGPGASIIKYNAVSFQLTNVAFSGTDQLVFSVTERRTFIPTGDRDGLFDQVDINVRNYVNGRLQGPAFTPGTNDQISNSRARKTALANGPNGEQRARFEFDFYYANTEDGG